MLQRIGKYEVLETIAGGGQGSVYRARDAESNAVVALKVMHPGHTGEIHSRQGLAGRDSWQSRTASEYCPHKL